MKNNYIIFGLLFVLAYSSYRNFGSINQLKKDFDSKTIISLKEKSQDLNNTELSKNKSEQREIKILFQELAEIKQKLLEQSSKRGLSIANTKADSNPLDNQYDNKIEELNKNYKNLLVKIEKLEKRLNEAQLNKPIIIKSYETK